MGEEKTDSRPLSLVLDVETDNPNPLGPLPGEAPRLRLPRASAGPRLQVEVNPEPKAKPRRSRLALLAREAAELAHTGDLPDALAAFVVDDVREVAGERVGDVAAEALALGLPPDHRVVGDLLQLIDQE